jgi:large subunit ribosomal protein L28
LSGCPAVSNAGDPTDRHFEETPVASVCDICGKRPGFGHNVSHSHRRTNRRWNPNIQTVRTPAGGGTTKKLKVCTSCIKAGKVVRA